MCVHGHIDVLQSTNTGNTADAILVSFVFLCNQRHQERVLKLENALIFAGLATIRKAGVHSDPSFAGIFTTNSRPPLFFSLSRPY